MWDYRLPLDAGGSSQRRVKGQITGSSAGGLKAKACLRCGVTVQGLGKGSVFSLQVVPKLGDAAA